VRSKILVVPVFELLREFNATGLQAEESRPEFGRFDVTDCLFDSSCQHFSAQSRKL
jgi:hypothetical protein